jgi:putative transposase
MARLPRLVIPGHAHYIVQRGHNGQPVMLDDEDRALYLAALREAFVPRRVDLLAYALSDDAVHLLATPPDAAALSSAMQAVGRRYVAAFNRRHGRSGTLWDGRFRGTVVEPGGVLLEVLRLIDGLPAARSSAAHHLGELRDPLLTDPSEFWHLGNTPFEREAAWRTLLVQGLPALRRDALALGALRGWALGSPAFLATLAADTQRPLQPKARGRPRKGAAPT